MHGRVGRGQVWAVPPRDMQCDWLGERVATVDVKRAITNVLHNKEDAGWGPNAVFRFPLDGGTGGIWKAVAAQLPQDRLVRRIPPPPLSLSLTHTLIQVAIAAH